MAGRRDDLVEVVLDDDGPESAAADGHDDPQRLRRPRRPWTPRRRRAVTAAGLALAVGVLAVRWDAATLGALPLWGCPGSR